MQVTRDYVDYEIIDSSNGMKYEKWGKYYLLRPDPQIMWDNGDLEKIYKDNSELINIVKATYTDDRRTSVALFNEKSEKIAELLAENQY